jgi:hypothetical protein
MLRIFHAHVTFLRPATPLHREHKRDTSATSERDIERQKRARSGTVSAGGYTPHHPPPAHDLTTRPPPGARGRPATTLTTGNEPDSGGLSASCGTCGAGLEGSRFTHGQQLGRWAHPWNDSSEGTCRGARSLTLTPGTEKAAVYNCCVQLCAEVCTVLCAALPHTKQFPRSRDVWTGETP